MKKNSVRTLVVSLVAIVICFTMLLGTTFAWFTDSVSSSNNKIESGTLKVDLELYDKDAQAWASIKESHDPIFDYDNWEPGYTDVKLLKVENEGTLALKWKARFVSSVSLSALADVIDVYVCPSDTELSFPTRELVGYNKVGTVKDFVNTIEETTKGELAEQEVAYLGIALKMQETAGNEYQGLSLGGAFDIQIVATQFTAEEDSFGNDFDTNATYPNVSLSVAIPDSATESETFSAGIVEAKLPADLLNNLPAQVESAKLVVADPEIDETNNTVLFSAVDFVDQDGEVIDLSANDVAFTVTLNVPSLAGEIVNVYHDGELIANKVVNADGTLTYEANHFCEVEIKATEGDVYEVGDEEFTLVSNADELVAALEAGENVIFTDNIKIDPANMSNAYGTTGINVINGQTIDGNGNVLDIKGAGGTWDSGINTTGGIIKNITITGSFRGIFINHNSTHSEPVVLENVILDGTVYTISCDQGMNQSLVATNCTFKGWTSYAATLGNAKFVDCYFGEGRGYSFCRPYASTEFVGCEFEAGFRMDTQAETTFEGCKLAGEVITADNLATLVTSNISNASVK